MTMVIISNKYWLIISMKELKAKFIKCSLKTTKIDHYIGSIWGSVFQIYFKQIDLR